MAVCGCLRGADYLNYLIFQAGYDYTESNSDFYREKQNQRAF